jgi:hypothetical protein
MDFNPAPADCGMRQSTIEPDGARRKRQNAERRET